MIDIVKCFKDSVDRIKDAGNLTEPLLFDIVSVREIPGAGFSRALKVSYVYKAHTFHTEFSVPENILGSSIKTAFWDSAIAKSVFIARNAAFAWELGRYQQMKEYKAKWAEEHQT